MSMILESPFYPNSLNQQLQCQWVVHGLPGKRIRLDFEDFFLVKVTAQNSFKYVFEIRFKYVHSNEPK